MAFDLAAWAVIFVAVWLSGVALSRCWMPTAFARGDRLILAAWIGVIVCAVTLLGVSLFTALTPLFRPAPRWFCAR
jgi:hypothetical protein